MANQRQTPICQYFKPLEAKCKKTNFIYDVSTCKAWFADTYDECDTFVGGRCGIKLWKRASGDIPPIHEYRLPKVRIPIPLLKSHLQKAIRRQNVDLALKTTYSMLAWAPCEILRRLPIIMIEDVAFIQGASTIIWLMMACKEHKLTEKDNLFIKSFVVSLCKTDDVFPDRRDEDPEEHTHEGIANMEHPHLSELLALRIRCEYGGMHCDMRMLKRALTYYKENQRLGQIRPWHISPQSVHLTLDYTGETFLLEAIDFHPYPHITKEIHDQTGVRYNTIKKLIWCVESSLNVRRPLGYGRAKELRESEEWAKIAPVLKSARRSIIERLVSKVAS